MASVLIPQAQPKKKTSGASDLGAAFGRILPVAGAVIGGVAGVASGGALSPAGASMGYGAGQAASSLFGLNQTTEYAQGPSSQGIQNSAAGRRMAQIEQDPYTQLAQANRALEYAPKDVQEAYRKPLEEALTIAQKSKQAGGIA